MKCVSLLLFFIDERKKEQAKSIMDKMGRYARMYLNDVMAKLPYIVQPLQQTNYDDLLQLLPHKWKLTHEEAMLDNEQI